MFKRVAVAVLAVVIVCLLAYHPIVKLNNDNDVSAEVINDLYIIIDAGHGGLTNTTH